MKLLDEFREYLKEESSYDEKEIEALLSKEWDGAIPTCLVGTEDVTLQIEGFLNHMAKFALKKAGASNALISVEGSYDEHSHILIAVKDKIVYRDWFKTWHFTPEYIEKILEEMVEKLKASKKITTYTICDEAKKIVGLYLPSTGEVEPYNLDEETDKRVLEVVGRYKIPYEPADDWGERAFRVRGERHTVIIHDEGNGWHRILAVESCNH